jgi:hypothetical protein
LSPRSTKKRTRKQQKRLGCLTFGLIRGAQRPKFFWLKAQAKVQKKEKKLLARCGGQARNTDEAKVAKKGSNEVAKRTLKTAYRSNKKTLNFF